MGGGSEGCVMAGTSVVFDIETQNLINDMPGIDRESKIKMLEVSCLSYLVLQSKELLAGGARAARAVEEAAMHTLWRDEDPDNVGPFEPMLKAFDEAEVIATYNGCGFDHLAMIKYYQGDNRRYQRHMAKAHDCFSRLRDATEMWYKLDALLKENGIPTKTANGLVAIQWWAEGKRELLQEYCEGDVRALARLLALPQLKLPRTAFRAPNAMFGLASAIAASRTSAALLPPVVDIETEPGPNAAPGVD